MHVSVGIVFVESSSNQNLSSQTSAPPIGSTVRGSGIDESSMPKRYQRKPLTSLEMEFIEVRVFIVLFIHYFEFFFLSFIFYQRGGPDTL